MRFVYGDVNVYYAHDTLTPGNVRAAVYGSLHGVSLVPEVGDVLRNFPGWDGTEHEPIIVEVTAVTRIGEGCEAYEVCTRTLPV